MYDYSKYVFYDKLVSPINGYVCKRINAQNIKNFGCDTITDFLALYPNFPLRCEANKNIQKENNNIMLTGYVAYSKKMRKKLKTEYYTNPKKCKQCNSIINYDSRNNIFCNYSCAAIFSNKNRILSPKPKSKKSCKVSFCEVCNTTIPNKIQKTCSKECKNKICKVSFCVICNKVIPIKIKKTCNKECTNALISKKIKIAFEEGRHKGNLYRSRNSPSYMENSFNKWLIDMKCKYAWETEAAFRRYDSKGNYERCYFVDFFFPELKLIIELDGTHHLNQIKYDLCRDQYIIDNYDSVDEIIRIPYKEYISLDRVGEIISKLDID